VCTRRSWAAGVLIVLTTATAGGQSFEERWRGLDQQAERAPTALLPRQAEKVEPPLEQSLASADSGWWVILASIPLTPDNLSTPEAIAQAKRVGASASKCGFQTVTDLSAKFGTFATGYTVVVIGPFSLARANEVRQLVSRCVEIPILNSALMRASENEIGAMR